MVLKTRITCFTLAAVLALCSTIAPLAASAAGDGVIDVRCVQRLGLALLGAQSADQREADLNHDGRVDILDFQRAVNQATGVVPSDHANPPAPPLSPQPPTKDQGARELVSMKVAAAAVIPLPTPTAPADLAPVVARANSPKDALARLGLSAHAPPCC